MIIDADAYLAHYGILRRSGRYPWGSGGTQSERNQSFLDTIEELRKSGMSEAEAAKLFDMTTTQLRALKSIAGTQQKQERIAEAERLKAKGMSNIAIGKQMGINESSVRSLLDPGQKERADILQTTSSMLKRQVDEKGYIDIGEGVENYIGISGTKLKTAVEVLKEEGYEVHFVQIDQMMGKNQKTTIKVLAPPGTTYREIVANKDKIKQIQEFSEDHGRTMIGLEPPLNVSSKRIAINYSQKNDKGEEIGGGLEDGVIHVRPGVDDLSLGGNRYAQVRIAVDGTHYLKGMAVYKDDLPDGVDLVFNTNKKDTGNKLDAMKPQQKGAFDDDGPDVTNPFGSSIRRQIIEVGPDGKTRVTSAMNIINEDATWETWNKSLSTQVLSKQSPTLAKRQLDMTFERKKQEFDEIMALTNPTVRRELLEKFADGVDSSAVHMKAAALPRQANQVIMPINSLKDNEVYAPNFRSGEKVVLVRYPHGGKFEIPELTVNNNNREGKKILGPQAKAAIGINAKVAERLSGADFDGDTVVVIPNNAGLIKHEKALKSLKGFDPQTYKLPDDAPPVSARTKGLEMGKVSNLITDMTIKGAGPDELARAVKHSMVVIDAEKHHLDWKRSARDNGISALNAKYQPREDGRNTGGSSTIISRAKSPIRVPDRKLRSMKDGIGPIDPKTGKKRYNDEPESFVTKDGVLVIKTRKSQKLAETDDAFTLVGDKNDAMETTYANHSNRLKAMANEARKEMVAVKPNPYSPAAKKAYAAEVESLHAKLDLARRNKPKERQAQIIAKSIMDQKLKAHGEIDPPTLKKEKARALAQARIRTNAEKQLIRPTPQEWAAIQAGAISNHQLTQILKSADIDAIKALATPNVPKLMSPAKMGRAADMLANGFTQAEVADQLGVSLTTLKDALAE